MRNTHTMPIARIAEWRRNQLLVQLTGAVVALVKLISDDSEEDEWEVVDSDKVPAADVAENEVQAVRLAIAAPCGSYL